jgi:hypothetical protein
MGTVYKYGRECEYVSRTLSEGKIQYERLWTWSWGEYLDLGYKEGQGDRQKLLTETLHTLHSLRRYYLGHEIEGNVRMAVYVQPVKWEYNEFWLENLREGTTQKARKKMAITLKLIWGDWKIRGFHGGDYEECCLLECYSVWFL